MIRNKIQKCHRAYNPLKGFNYANRQARNMFMVTFAAFGVILLLGALLDHSLGMASASGLSLASMAMLGHIDDVSDRDTHGSDISYIVYLVAIDQIDRTKDFPQPNAQREVAPIPLKKGEIPHYFEAHDIPTFTGTTEKGDITTTGENQFVIIMGGARAPLYNFIEEYGGGKFIIFFKHIKSKEWYIIGELERPIILSNTETKDDKDGRYTTFTFKRSSVDLPLIYTGNPAMNASTEVSAGATEIAIYILLLILSNVLANFKVNGSVVGATQWIGTYLCVFMMVRECFSCVENIQAIYPIFPTSFVRRLKDFNDKGEYIKKD